MSRNRDSAKKKIKSVLVLTNEKEKRERKFQKLGQPNKGGTDFVGLEAMEKPKNTLPTHVSTLQYHKCDNLRFHIKEFCSHYLHCLFYLYL